MNSPVLIYVCVCCFLFPWGLHAKKNEKKAPERIIFHQLSQQDGLSQNNVNDIIQDRRGFLWIATENGLNRYDGYEFLHLFGANGLPNDQVTALLETQDGMIWVGTRSGGVAQLDPATLQFDVYPPQENEVQGLKGTQVQMLYEDRAGRLWVGDRREGLHCLDRQEQKWYSFPDGTLGLRNGGIYGMVEDENGRYWVASTDGLYKLEEIAWSDSGIWEGKYRQHQILETSQEREVIYAMCLHPDGGLWLNIWKQGLFLWDADHGLISRYEEEIQVPEGLLSNRIRKIFVDRQKQLWLCNFDHGLSMMRPETGVFTHFRHEAGNPQHLKSDFTTSIFQDRSGVLWVGTFGSGLNHYSPFREKFMRYRQEANNANSLSSDYVFSIQESRIGPAGSLWVGTHDNGLNLMLREASGQYRFRHFAHEEQKKQSLSYDAVLTLTEDHSGNLWVGTYQGLNRLPARQVRALLSGQEIEVSFDHFFPQSPANNGLQNASIWNLLEDRQHRLWVGTHRGLHQYLPQQDRFVSYLPIADDPHSISHASILALYHDSKDRLWIGTQKGLNVLFDIPAPGDSAEFFHFLHTADDSTGLRGDWIYQIAEDQKGRIWVGTRGEGLHVLMEEDDLASGHFVHVGESDGLCSNSISSMEVDMQGYLWVSTNLGLCVFHPDSLLASLAQGTPPDIRSFDAKDGLQGTEFTDRASAIGQDGKLYFGGLNGFNAFYPEDIQENPIAPEVYVTGIRILDRDIQVGGHRTDGRLLLPEDLPFMEALGLSYRDYSFRLFFSALDFTSPDKNHYVYRLDGFEEDWRNGGTEHSVTYTNLDPGSYTFRLKASNHDGYWSQERQVQINIDPPPWKTWWAYLLYALLFISLVYSYIRYQIRQRERQYETQRKIEIARQEEREQIRRRTAADFHDELGHRMTKISLFVELAKRTSPIQESLHTYLSQVSDQTQILSEGIRDFTWMLDPDKDSLFDLALRLKDFGEELFDHTEVVFRTHGFLQSWQEIQLPLQMRRHLVLIFKEAMNNVLKYAEASEVLLEVNVADDTLELSCIDNGKGIREAKSQGSGYGLKNMKSRAAQMDGQLDISSEPDKGTIIRLTVMLP